MQQTPKWLKDFIKWFPTGIGGVATGHFAIAQQWKEAVLSSMVTAGLSLWAKFSTGFMEELEKGVNERGKKSAQSLLKQTDTLPGKIRWITSGFQDKYYHSLVDKCLKLKTEGFNIGLSALNLEDVFVPLKVVSSVPRNVAGGIITDIKPTLNPRLAESQSSGEIWHFLAKGSGKIGNDRCIVILAPPGSGKTTLLQHITLTYAQNNHRKDKHKRKAPTFIPVLLRLRDVREKLIKPKPPSLNELIREEVKGLPSSRKLNPPPNWFEERLNNGKCLVMLDGLDEVTKQSERSDVSRWVSEQMRNYSRATFILTSRPHGYQREILGEQVDRVLAVQPFTLAQMKGFIHKWYEQTEINQERRNSPAVRREAEEKAKDLIEALLQNPAIRKMASNPLLVTMIATVHYLGNALPGRRVELYKEICDVLLGRRIYAKKLNLPLTAEQNQLLLQKLALDLMQKGTQKFTSQEAKSLIQGELEKASTTQLTVEEWLEIIKNNVGLIVEKEVGSYEFAHLSFQEYLAAVELKKLIQADKNTENILIQNLPNSSWAETIRLYAAQSQDNTKLIQFALQNHKVASLSLAYDCLQEGGKQKIQRETQSQLEEKLVLGLESSEPKIAIMAAKVSLSRRLNRLLIIDDNISIDHSYINCAEYQLFVNDQLNSHFYFQYGSSKRPITGITYQNAIQFCTWLNRNASSLIINNGNIENIYYYRLPTVQETEEIPAKKESQQLECWTIGESNTSNPENKGIRVIRAKIPTTYIKLANYLATEAWEQADEETAQIMLKVANRESAGNFDVESIKKFPCSEFNTIDRLWLHYSSGRFSLGIQATISETVGGNQITGHFPKLWCLNYSANTKEIFSNFVRRLMACGIQSPLPMCEFDVVTVNSQGQEIQREQNQAAYFTENLGNGVGLDLVAIPRGTFMMGTEDEEIERLVKKFDWDGFRAEKPQHQVTVPTFFMGKYPVIQAQWKAVAALPKVSRDLKAEPSHFKGDNHPVEQVSWYDAVEFCDRLSQYTGRQYRLPSEAEWEYACRAGTTTPFHFGETITADLANYRASEIFAEESKRKYREQTTPVGLFLPNAFGLYDMHGNVWEWCLDDWHNNYEGAPIDGSPWFKNNNEKNYQLLRGGSWGDYPRDCRSAYRLNNYRAERDSIINDIGFRVVCAVGRALK